MPDGPPSVREAKLSEEYDRDTMYGLDPQQQKILGMIQRNEEERIRRVSGGSGTT